MNDTYRIGLVKVAYIYSVRIYWKLLVEFSYNFYKTLCNIRLLMSESQTVDFSLFYFSFHFYFHVNLFSILRN